MVTDPFSTKTYAIKGIVIFLGGIVCALIAFSIHWYLTYTPEGINDPLLLDYGLVAANEVNSSIPSGYLYLLGSPAVPAGIQLSEPLTSRYYALPLANTDTLRPLPTTPEATQLTDSNRQYGLAILDIESPTVADDKFHPGLIDYQTNELTVLNTLPLYSETQLVAAPPTTSNRQWVAYSGRTIPIDDTITNIDTWQIVIYNPNTNELRTIPG